MSCIILAIALILLWGGPGEFDPNEPPDESFL
jgi:hypothetical protein